MDANHLTHTNGTTTVTPDFDILPPINTPKASDRLAWNNISESFATLHEINPIYRQSDPSSIKLKKLNTFTVHIQFLLNLNMDARSQSRSLSREKKKTQKRRD